MSHTPDQHSSRVAFLSIVSRNSANNPYYKMLQAVKDRLDLEHSEAVTFYSHLYSTAGLFPRLLSAVEISERLNRLVHIEIEYTQHLQILQRFKSMLDLLTESERH
jgi:hypothetical protein